MQITKRSDGYGNTILTGTAKEVVEDLREVLESGDTVQVLNSSGLVISTTQVEDKVICSGESDPRQDCECKHTAFTFEYWGYADDYYPYCAICAHRVSIEGEAE